MGKLVLLAVCLVLGAVLYGCGDVSTPQNYVGVYKSIRTNNGKDVKLTITQDDGTSYTGTIDTFPVSAKWGESKSDALGLTTYQLVKGSDLNLFDFYLSISSSVISGTALRQ